MYLEHLRLSLKSLVCEEPVRIAATVSGRVRGFGVCAFGRVWAPGFSVQGLECLALKYRLPGRGMDIELLKLSVLEPCMGDS